MHRMQSDGSNTLGEEGACVFQGSIVDRHGTSLREDFAF